MPDIFLRSTLPWTLVALLLTLFALIAMRRRRERERIIADAERAARRELQFGRSELRALTELAADWIWKTDSHHAFTLLSDGFTATTGIGQHVALESRVWKLDWLPVDGDWTAYRSAVENARPARVTVRRRHEGHDRHFEILAKPRFDRGVCIGYLGIGRDVTARVENKRALEESRALYLDVVNSVREVVFRTDDAMRFSLLNQAWFAITNHPVEDSLEHRILDYLHPDDHPNAEAGLSRVLTGEQREYHASLRLFKRNGEITWIELTARRIVGDGQNQEGAGLVGTIDDISSRKIAEMNLRNINQELEARVRARTAELEASNRELEAFSYSVSHDLRAPLRSIDGFARIIEEDLGDKLDASTRNHLERIRNAAARMSYLSDKLIELARFTRHALKKESVNLSEMAAQVVEELRAENPERVVDVEVVADMVAIADKNLVRVVLDNLFHNAWKFTANTNPAKISFTVSMEDGRRIFCISDNGVGFDMAFASNLFRPFYRLHDEADFKGSGIGLANVQRIIQRHGGKIWADARPGEGARFCFTLNA